jgi:hypothetical protein
MYEHEAREDLKPDTIDLERARQSAVEQLQAINWYSERIDATKDKSLRRLLTHNRNEEMEHFAFLVQWIREHDVRQDLAFKKKLEEAVS